MLVTHDQSEALLMGHQVAVLWDGQRVQVASPEQLYRMPVSPELARFVGDAVLTMRLPGHLCPRPGDEVAIIVEGEVLAYRTTDPASAATTAPQWAPSTSVLGVAKP